MRARTITTIAALGLAGVLMAPMAHAATTSEPPAEVQAAAAQAAAAAEADATDADAPDAKGGGGFGHHGEGDFFELIGFFDHLHECVSTADWVEDHFDADTVCVPERGGHHHGFGSSEGHEGGGEDKDWLLFAAFPHWVHHHHH